MATANDPRSIPDPILSRMQVFEIPAPTRDESRVICTAIYREIRESHVWGQPFPDVPADDVLDVLVQVSPREVNQILVDAFGSAKMAKRQELKTEDFAPVEAKKRPMGF